MEDAAGDPAGEVWTPEFTYHGFQYVELSGYPGVPGTDDLGLETQASFLSPHRRSPILSQLPTRNPLPPRHPPCTLAADLGFARGIGGTGE